MTSNHRLVVLAGLCVCLYMVLTEAHALDGDLEAIRQSGVKFANNLYEVVSQEEGNLLFSPMNIHCILTMTSLGARAETAEQLKKGLSLPNSDVTINGYTELLRLLENSKKVTLKVANRIYPGKRVAVVPEFSQKSLAVFGSEIQQVHFNKGKETADTINKWVENKTNKKIKNIVSPGDFDGDTVMVLVSAVYFMGMWQTRFVTIGNKGFHMNSGTVEVPMMHCKGMYGYKDNGKVRMVELPYKGEEVRMFVILPSDEQTLSAVEDELKTGALDGFLQGLGSNRLVDVLLPIFRLEKAMGLKEVLIKMGMPIIFQSGADFKGMISSRDAYVGRVIHKAFIDVNENGTEAAAVTLVVHKTKSLRRKPRPIKFHVQEPFIFVLHHRESGQVLFMGRCVDPRG